MTIPISEKIERYGSGIMRVRHICKDYGIVEPQFSEVSNGFMVTLFKELLSKDINTHTDNDTVDIDNVPVNDTLNDTLNEL